MNTREFVGARPDIIIIIVIIVYYAEATQYSEAIKQTKKAQYTNSVYRTEIISAITCTINKMWNIGYETW